jgi:flagellar biosynthesis/type III secretory pathway chaperone
MNRQLEQLVFAIESETTLLEDMHTLLQEKKKAVVGARIDMLDRLGEKCHTLKDQIRQAEWHRRTLFSDIARRLDCHPDQLSLKKLALAVKEPHASRLLECRDAVLDVTERVRGLNGAIRSLLSHSMQLVAGSINVLSSMTAAPTVYGDRGMTQGNHQSGRLLSRNV